MRAVTTLGSGILSSVRVIHLAAQNLFWFEVDSDNPSLHGHSAVHASPEPRSKAVLPAWALSNKPLFPLRQIADERDLRLVGDSNNDFDHASEASEVAQRLSRKAKHWQQRYWGCQRQLSSAVHVEFWLYYRPCIPSVVLLCSEGYLLCSDVVVGMWLICKK